MQQSFMPDEEPRPRRLKSAKRTVPIYWRSKKYCPIFGHDWSVFRRYRDEATAQKAVKCLNAKDSSFDYRM